MFYWRFHVYIWHKLEVVSLPTDVPSTLQGPCWSPVVVVVNSGIDKSGMEFAEMIDMFIQSDGFSFFFFELHIGSSHFAACLFLLDMISWRWGATKNLFCFDMIFHCPDLPPPQLALEQQSYWLQIVFSVLPVLFARCCCWLTACTHKNTTFYLFNLNFYHF